jgi:UDP-N-acetylmuramoyl-L-alanyl-D-glutamate--2,6-diaminopimelate ligase
MPLGELAAADGSLRLTGDPQTPVRGLAYDARTVQPGDLFAALDGDEFRGHAFAAEAVARGAAALLLEHDVGVEVPMLLAERPRASLARVAAAFHGHPGLELGTIGVTGTDGKTTTIHLIEAILRAAGLLSGSISTIGVRVGDEPARASTRLTTPESPDVQAELRRMLDAGAHWAVVEATSHGLALDRLAGIPFAVGAVTNVTHEHQDFHGSPAAYRRAKAILFEAVGAAGGTAVVNGDDEAAIQLLDFAGGARVLRFSAAGAPADVVATGVELDADGARFVLGTPAGAVPVKLPLPGSFNVANALCAAACALAAGILLEAIARGLEGAPAVPGRMMRIDAGQDFVVLVDFAHTPAALAAVLASLRDLHPEGRMIAVLGSAGERDLLKRPWLGEVAERGADYTVLTVEDPRFEDPDEVIAQIAAGARSAGGVEGETFVRITDRRAAIRHALERARRGDCVLLAGKGHERSIVWGSEERPWDEAAVARELLAELGHAAPVSP